MNISVRMLIIIFISTSIHLHPVVVNRALVRETQQLLTRTFGNFYPLSCYEEVTTLLLYLEQRLKCSLRVESSEFEKNSLLYAQRLLSEFVLFSSKVNDNLLKGERDIVYISFLIQHTYYFFGRHAPTFLEGRNRPPLSAQQQLDSNHPSPVIDNKARFILNGIGGVIAFCMLYAFLKRYFLSSMARDVQKFDRDISKILKVNDDTDVKVSKIVEDVLAGERIIKSVDHKLAVFQSSQEESMKALVSFSHQLLEDYDGVIESSNKSIKVAQDALEEKVKKIDECCSLITLQTAKIGEHEGLLAVLFKPYALENTLWAQCKARLMSNESSRITNEDITHFFKEQ